MPKWLPEGLHTVTPQLTVEGAAEALAFYAKAFGAEEKSRAPDPSGKKLWHAEFRIGDSTLFINDAFPEMGGPANQTRLWIYTDDVDAAYQRALAAGATKVMEPADMFWGDRIAAVRDRWGNQWSLASRQRQLTPEQMKAEQDAFVAKNK